MLSRADRPWTNVYGLARSLLALATLLALVSDSAERIFHPLIIDDIGVFDRSGSVGISLFFLARAHLALAKLLAIVVLLLVISGWRPRLTALPHWWISYSFAASAAMVDGGDLIVATITLLLLPVALTDSRRSHWAGIGAGGTAASIAAQTGLVLVRVQMAVVYLFAAVLKFPSEEWANGTALYYFWRHPIFGSPGFLRPLTEWFGRSVLVVPVTWGVLLLELSLATALVAPLRFRARLLPLALLFHLGIAVIHGMPTFALAMAGGLVLYLRPTWQSFPLPARLRRPFARGAEPVAQPSIAR
jgi:antimicrobial peptide system SdpB family protein